jgi:hypothetical protein
MRGEAKSFDRSLTLLNGASQLDHKGFAKSLEKNLAI